MAMDQEARTEALDNYKLMSADELNSMKGDDAEQDALIDEVLSGGKQVASKGGQSADDEHSGQEGTHHSMGSDGEDDDQDSDDADDDTDADADDAPDAPDAAAAAAPDVDAAPVVDAVADAPAEAAPAPTNDDLAAALPPPDLSYVNTTFADRLTALDSTKAEALAKLMGGEIDAAEYSKIESQYMRDRDGLHEEKREAVAWVGDIHKFQQQALRDTGINYAADPEKAQSLDQWVRVLGAKSPDADGKLILAQAHKKVMVEFDIAPAAKAAPAPAAAPAPVKPKGRAPDLSGIPPTLGSLPAASNPGSGDGGEFAHLSTLSGMKLEQALARLSPEQQDRYLSE